MELFYPNGLEGRMIPALIQQKEKLQKWRAQKQQIDQDFLLDNKEFLQDEIQKSIKSHVKLKQQKRIIEYQINTMRGRDLESENKKRYTDMVHVMGSRNYSTKQMETLVGPAEPLIKNVKTNRFFTISNAQKSISPANSTSCKNRLLHTGDDSDQLDFGYMEYFDRMKGFKLIHLGKVRPETDKRAHLNKLLNSTGKIIHRLPETRCSPNREYFERTNNTDHRNRTPHSTYNADQRNRTPQTHLYNTLISDPYEFDAESDREISENRLRIQRKQKRLNIVNRRIMQQFNLN